MFKGVFTLFELSSPMMQIVMGREREREREK